MRKPVKMPTLFKVASFQQRTPRKTYSNISNQVQQNSSIIINVDMSPSIQEDNLFAKASKSLYFTSIMSSVKQIHNCNYNISNVCQLSILLIRLTFCLLPTGTTIEATALIV